MSKKEGINSINALNKEEPQDVNQQFLISCRNNKFEHAIRLLPQINNIDIKEEHSCYTPFIYAVINKNFAAVEFFIKAKANVNVIVGYGKYHTCALDILVSDDTFDDNIGNILKLILDNNGDLNIRFRNTDIGKQITLHNNIKFLEFLFEHKYMNNEFQKHLNKIVFYDVDSVNKRNFIELNKKYISHNSAQEIDLLPEEDKDVVSNISEEKISDIYYA